MAYSAQERARNAAKAARTWAAIAFILCFVVVLVSAWAASVGPVTPGGDRAHMVLTAWVSAAPIAMLLVSLLQLRAAFADFAEGRFISSTSARAVQTAGWIAIGAMLVKATVVKSAEASTSGNLSLQIGFEASDIAMIALLLFVAVLGHVLELAVSIKAENEKFV